MLLLAIFVVAAAVCRRVGTEEKLFNDIHRIWSIFIDAGKLIEFKTYREKQNNNKNVFVRPIFLGAY